MDEIEVPSHFLCPISMQLMRDPVILSTGITYDRENIEKWLFSCKSKTCPATKQELLNNDLTPNHTLRRLIQSWCTLNESHGIERIPTPKPPVDKSQVLKLVNDAKKSPETQLKCLQRLRSIAHGCYSNKKNILEAPGVIEFLASVVKKNVGQLQPAIRIEEGFLGLGLVHPDGIATLSPGHHSLVKVIDGALDVLCALDILCHIELSERDMKNLMRDDDGAFLDSLMHVLKFGNYQSRGYALMLVKSLYDVADSRHLISVGIEFFTETVHVLEDKISQQVTKSVLKLLVELSPWGRNRIKAVEGGAISALVEYLLDTTERRPCELALMALDLLCQCAEGRAELLKHAAGLAVVSKKILRVSHVASDRAVRILSSISKFSANSRVLQEMLEVGVVAKLCLVLQVESSPKTKERTKEILRLHSRVWRGSPCVPHHLLSSYPSS